MIGSVSLNTTQVSAYTQASRPTTQAQQTSQTEIKETKTREKNEPVSVQLREPESFQSGAALLKTLNSNENQTLPAAQAQQQASAEANRANAMKAYGEAGQSQFKFA